MSLPPAQNPFPVHLPQSSDDLIRYTSVLFSNDVYPPAPVSGPPEFPRCIHAPLPAGTFPSQDPPELRPREAVHGEFRLLLMSRKQLPAQKTPPAHCPLLILLPHRTAPVPLQAPVQHWKRLLLPLFLRRQTPSLAAPLKLSLPVQALLYRLLPADTHKHPLLPALPVHLPHQSEEP